MSNNIVQISKEAKTVFAAILKQFNAAGGEHIKIDNNGKDSGLMPLVVECVGEGIGSAWGTGKLISFAHYYEQQGDLMRDPEVVFFVVDNRTAEDETFLDLLGVWPQMFQQDGTFPTYQELIIIEDNKLEKFRAKQQKDCAVFSAQWMKNIKFQQNISPIRPKVISQVNGKIEICKPAGMVGKFEELMDRAKELGYPSISAAIAAGKGDQLCTNK